MDVVLNVAKHAHEAADIYAKEKVSTSEGRARKDVHLANALMRGSLDQDVATELAQEAARGSCPECAHSYDVRCPVGWASTAEGTSCEATGDYGGPCALKLFVAGLSPKEKADLESRCSVCWPCAA